MGLLDDITDTLSGNGMDANSKAALKQGLLTMGLNMMAGKGNLAQVIGQSGLQGAAAYQQAQQAQQQNALRDLQLQQARQQIEAGKRAAEQQQRQQEFLQNLPSPGFEASQQALAGGGGPTVANAARIAPVDPQQSMLLGAVKAGAMPLQSYLDATRKDTSLIPVKANEVLLDPRTRKPVFSNVQPDTELAKLQQMRAGMPPGDPRIAEVNAMITKLSTHQPATSVNVSMDKGFSETFAKDAASSLAASRDKARSAANTLQALDRIDAAVAGGAITGPGADVQSTLLRVGSALGVGGKNAADTLSKTADLMQAQAQLAVGGAQMLAGQGQITEGERKLVDRAAGGNLQQFSAPEIRQLTGVLRKVNTQTIAQHNAELQNVPKNVAPYVPFYRVPMPAQANVPAGQTPRLGPGQLGFGGLPAAVPEAPNIDDLVSKYTRGR